MKNHSYSQVRKLKPTRYEALGKDDIIRILDFLKDKYSDQKISVLKHYLINDEEYTLDIGNKINNDLIGRNKLRKK